MVNKIDIQTEMGGVTFKCRSAAIIKYEGKILFHKRKQDKFWTLPGGKVIIMEKSSQTVKREIKEELGIEVKVGNLIDVEENLFDYDGKKFHELIFIYCIKQSDDSTIFHETLFSGVEEDKNLIFKWFNRIDILNENIQPNISLKKILEEFNNIEETYVKGKIRKKFRK